MIQIPFKCSFSRLKIFRLVWRRSDVSSKGCSFLLPALVPGGAETKAAVGGVDDFVKTDGVS